MNIYKCYRVFMGYRLYAVVSSISVDDAKDLLGWSLGGDTTEIQIIKIGTGLNRETIWSEESL